MLLNYNSHSIWPFHALHFPSALLGQDWHSSLSFRTRFPTFCAPQFTLLHLGLVRSFNIKFGMLYHVPRPFAGLGSSPSPSALLTPDSGLFNPNWRSLIPVSAPQPWCGALFHSALLQYVLGTPLFHTALPLWPSPFPWWSLPVFIRLIIAF
jgi:hypothetical protein